MIVVFLHKIDLIESSYLLNKLGAIKEHFRVKYPEALATRICPTLDNFIVRIKVYLYLVSMIVALS